MKMLKIILLIGFLNLVACNELDAFYFSEKGFKSKSNKLVKTFTGAYTKKEFLEKLKETNEIPFTAILKSDFVLNLKGLGLIAKINHLVSEDGAKIVTFEEGAKAEPKIDGRSGGRIDLKLEEASGFLQIEMRGENGGDRNKKEFMKGGDTGKLKIISNKEGLFLDIILDAGVGHEVSGFKKMDFRRYADIYSLKKGMIFVPIIEGVNYNVY